jgi:hypothetical protein
MPTRPGIEATPADRSARGQSTALPLLLFCDFYKPGSSECASGKIIEGLDLRVGWHKTKIGGGICADFQLSC